MGRATTEDAPKVPVLRFPEFKEAWEEKRFDDLFKISAGGDFDADRTKKMASKAYCYPVYANGDKNGGLQGWANYYKEEPGCVTVSGRGNLGTPVARDHKFVPIVRLLVLRPLTDADIIFFENAIERTRFYVESTGVPQLTGPQISSYKLANPTLPEQKKIAAFLGAVDARTLLLRRRHAALSDYKKAMMQRLFSQDLRFTRDDGTAFPDWEERRLGEVAEFTKGKGVSKNDLSETGQTPCIRYAELYTQYGEVITDVVSATDISPAELSISKKGDVIIPASGEAAIEIGAAACVTIAGVALGGDLNIIRSHFHGPFLAAYLRHEKQLDIAKLAQGNSVVHLYASQLKELRISFPHPYEQQKIADFLSALDTKIDAVSKQIDAMQAFKKGLLQQMFV